MHPRNELLAWLGTKKSLGVEPFIVADDVPHTEGSVDDRVDKAIRHADKAIAILTSDDRSPYGAPNVIDEIGRWRGGKGKKTLCILRQDGVPPYSNQAGIVSVNFKASVSEKFDALREFLLDEVIVNHPETVGLRDLVIDASPNMGLLNGFRFHFAQLDEFHNQIDMVIVNITGDEEVALRGLSQPRTLVEVVYGNALTSGQMEKSRLTRQERGLTAALTIRRVEPEHRAVHEMSWGGPLAMSVNEIAALRVSRILFDNPAEVPNGFGPEMLIRGGLHGGLQITKSPIPLFLAQHSRADKETWEILRLLLVQQLRASRSVEHVELLRLTVRGERLVRIEFRGRRAPPYTNSSGCVIEFDEMVDF